GLTAVAKLLRRYAAKNPTLLYGIPQITIAYPALRNALRAEATAVWLSTCGATGTRGAFRRRVRTGSAAGPSRRSHSSYKPPGPSSRGLWFSRIVRIALRMAGLGVGTSSAASAP